MGYVSKHKFIYIYIFVIYVETNPTNLYLYNYISMGFIKRNFLLEEKLNFIHNAFS